MLPYPASHETTQEATARSADQLIIPDDIRVTIGPRRLIEEISEHVVRHNKDIELVDPLTFRDTAFPSGGWSLQELLKSENRTRVAEKLDMQYLVLLTAVPVETEEPKGFLIPFLGAMAATEDSSLSALIIDLRLGSVVSQLTTQASGEGILLHYVIFIVAADPMTETAVIKGLSKSIAEALAAEPVSGSLRIAILAAESAGNHGAFQTQKGTPPTPEELEKHSMDVLFKPKSIKEMQTYCANADLGITAAQKNIGDIYYFGTTGIKKDLIQAFVWYSLAAKGGNKEATKQLLLLKDELSPRQAGEAARKLGDWKPGQCDKDIMDASYSTND